MTKTNLFNHRKIFYIFLFIIIFSYFLWLNSSPSFVDPDSFYHAKIAGLIREQGIIKDFTWLPFTTLNEIYIDHHLLYHLILVPLIFLMPALVAVKLAAVFFAALVILVFQWLLDKFKIKYSFIYTLILLLAHQFTFRINLAKVPALSLIVLLLFIYLLFTTNQRTRHGAFLQNQGKWSWPLFLLSLAYVWLYGGWVIMVGIGLIYLLTNIIYQWIDYKTLKFKVQSSKFKVYLSFLVGTIAGLIINPYFPTNLKFYWQQTFQIGLINYKDIIGVGGEWYGLNLFDLISYQVPILILLVVGLLLFFIYIKKQKPQNWTLFLTTLIFFILTLKSQRNLEYFIPFSLLFSAFSINLFLASSKKIPSFNQIKKFIQPYQAIVMLLLILVALYLPILLSANLKGLKDNLSKNYNFNQFAAVSHWFKSHTQPGEIIFHDDWDDWPVLFYHNSHNQYIVGLDPTFMYFKDQEQYWRWKNISTGQTKENICATVQSSFSSNYIFVKFDNQGLKKNLDLDNSCKLVYSDEDGWIYQIN